MRETHTLKIYSEDERCSYVRNLFSLTYFLSLIFLFSLIWERYVRFICSSGIRATHMRDMFVNENERHVPSMRATHMSETYFLSYEKNMFRFICWGGIRVTHIVDMLCVWMKMSDMFRIWEELISERQVTGCLSHMRETHKWKTGYRLSLTYERIVPSQVLRWHSCHTHHTHVPRMNANERHVLRMNENERPVLHMNESHICKTQMPPE